MIKKMKKYLLITLLFIEFAGYSQTSNDADAQAFITALNADPAGQLTVQQQNYVTQLVEGLKAIGIWTKMTAVYPFVGGTAFKHKFNLKDPRDLDVAYRLVFEGGGWSHTSLGIKGNGTSSYANTFINPNTVISNINSFSMQLYTDGSSDTGSDISLINTSTSISIALNAKFSIGGNASSQIYGGATNALSSLYPSSGFFIANRNSSSLNQLWRNGILIASNNTINTVDNISSLNNTIKISCLATTTTAGASSFSQFTQRQQRFVGFSQGLTNSESERLSHLIYYLQGILQRQ